MTFSVLTKKSFFKHNIHIDICLSGIAMKYLYIVLKTHKVNFVFAVIIDSVYLRKHNVIINSVISHYFCANIWCS